MSAVPIRKLQDSHHLLQSCVIRTEQRVCPHTGLASKTVGPVTALSNPNWLHIQEPWCNSCNFPSETPVLPFHCSLVPRWCYLQAEECLLQQCPFPLRIPSSLWSDHAAPSQGGQKGDAGHLQATCDSSAALSSSGFFSQVSLKEKKREVCCS